MADNIIEILVTERGRTGGPTGPSGGPTGGGPTDGGGAASGTSETTEQKSGRKETLLTSRGVGAIVKKLFPFVGAFGGAFGLIEIAKNSKVLLTFNRGMFSILGALMDIIFLPLMPLFSDILGALVHILPILMETAKNAVAGYEDISKIVNFLINLDKTIVNEGGKLIKNLGDRIWVFFKWLADAVPKLLSAGWETISEFIKELPDKIGDFITTAIGKIPALLEAIFDKIVKPLLDLIDKIPWPTVAGIKEKAREGAGWIAEKGGIGLKAIRDTLTGNELGNRYVPRTMPALLHQGERVISAKNNLDMMTGRNTINNSKGISVNITSGVTGIGNSELLHLNSLLRSGIERDIMQSLRRV